MTLVDTSVLIDYFKGRDTPAVQTFEQILDTGMPFGITEGIYQELLQGARTIGEFKKLKEYLEPLPFLHPQHGKETSERAAFLSFQCRRKGVTINSTMDFLIAEIALENGCALLHNDGDFDAIGRVIKSLAVL